MIRTHLHTESDGFICPQNDTFVTREHFLDKHDGKCSEGWPIEDHAAAKRVTSIYVEDDHG